MTVKIDLRSGLPKARKAFKRLLKEQPRMICEYTAPCVIGAMVTPAQRRVLEGGTGGSTAIRDLLKEGIASAPTGQRASIVSLQRAYDSGDAKLFRRTFERLEAKYAASGIEVNQNAEKSDD